ncbi:hypothetical protein [Mycoplasma phocimorsus]|uniref:hypothetical protein n=1 Tax=Mycoplasma phocimorsus TaxID=3045839 RepID=UPI0024BF4DA4|nr:hypothetical protein [Mycoplasma phocimorsus]MDJ1646865.1 hypothetical protein [Mycoplasma phocimorsus]
MEKKIRGTEIDVQVDPVLLFKADDLVIENKEDLLSLADENKLKSENLVIEEETKNLEKIEHSKEEKASPLNKDVKHSESHNSTNWAKNNPGKTAAIVFGVLAGATLTGVAIWQLYEHFKNTQYWEFIEEIIEKREIIEVIELEDIVETEVVEHIKLTISENNKYLQLLKICLHYAYKKETKKIIEIVKKIHRKKVISKNKKETTSWEEEILSETKNIKTTITNFETQIYEEKIKYIAEEKSRTKK